MSLLLTDIPLSAAGRIRPLWEELNRIHLADSTYFRDAYRAMDFDTRMAPIVKLDPARVKLTVAELDGKDLGYCVSTVREDDGELESLYLDPSLRGQGTGEALVRLHVEWMKAHGCGRIRVSVAEGHESVFGFYEKMGFWPRLTVLELKNAVIE